ncbi:BA14K family protein [Bradyrhizobium sp.]|uniref:BA14K family protein n=1 Tax=Bradyrhizobium sp. TaxID=376 RepID=UPI00239CDC21|nr:BA14K family protein [Bradyrhizobium sp.]MDE2377622.1 BA14K family protein [Bradyrhizobium sp.]
MNSLKVLGAAAAVALVLPMVTPTPSLAGGRGGGPAGGGHMSMGGGGAPHAVMGGGGPHFSGGGAPMMRSSGAPMMRSAGAPTSFSGGRSFAAASPGQWHGGGNWHGGNWHHHRHGGFWPGVAAGAAIGALGSYAYYGGPYYGDPYYYGDDYYYDDSPTVAVVPDGGGDSVAYCQQRYRSYDPASGTYLGYDGLRHPCP